MRGLLALTPLLELWPDRGDGGLIDGAGKFLINLLEEGLGIGEALGADGGFEEAEKGLPAQIAGSIGGAGEPALSLRKVVGLQVELTDGELLGRPRLNALGGEEGLEGFIGIPDLGVEVGEGDPDGAVVGGALEILLIVGDGPFAVAGLKQGSSCVEEILRLFRDELGDAGKGEGGHNGVVLGGVGKGEGFEDVDAVTGLITGLLEESDGAVDAAGVEVIFGGTDL